MKRSISWVVFHFGAVACAAVSLATGFRIAVLNHPALLWFDSVLPQGNVHSVHIVSGFTLAAISSVYFLQTVVRSLSRFFNQSSIPASPQNAYHRLVQWFGYLIIPLLLASGMLFFFDQSYWISLLHLHFIAACLLLVYVVLHGGGYFVHFGNAIFKRILLAEMRHRTVQLAIVAAALIIGVGGYWAWGSKPVQPLTVAAMDINRFMDIDGKANEPVWQQASKLTVQTHGGANFNHGSTPVTIQAAENGVEAYFLFTWNDPDKSLRHLPLVKKEQGWQVQHNGFYEFNEVEFYEDKFAVMLSDHCESAAAATVHLGSKPLADKPANWHGKGYHYAQDGHVRDVWHWKAVRTNDMYLADDNFFGAPQPARPGERRYSAGYLADGKESGAYVSNWLWFQPDSIVPRRIPKQEGMIAPYQNHTPNQSWVISWFDYEPYQPQKDQYPVGTVMPSVLYRSNRFEGDRADVRARGTWQNGQWTLEIARRLNTGSKNDVPLADGVCMWVSAFDHSQVAHTRHHQAIKLMFEGYRND
ncbi:MAG: hypothetical protein CSA49_03040 [Gammaproteobacteria bacterium]|nr:MAG: hypothetical protein CSA49_03040 [Gammaproteobacteria bacterium]